MFVSNLAPTVTEEAIKDLFGSIGIIKASLQQMDHFHYFKLTCAPLFLSHMLKLNKYLEECDAANP